MPTLTINKENIARLRGNDTVKAFADKADVDPATMSRLLSGKAEPGPKVIAGFLSNFPHPFDHFFRVTDSL